MEYTFWFQSPSELFSGAMLVSAFWVILCRSSQVRSWRMFKTAMCCFAGPILIRALCKTATLLWVMPANHAAITPDARLLAIKIDMFIAWGISPVAFVVGILLASVAVFPISSTTDFPVVDADRR